MTGMFIRIPDPDFSPIPDPKVPDLKYCFLG